MLAAALWPAPTPIPDRAARTVMSREDVRAAAVAAYEAGEGSFRVVADRFGVSMSTLKGWVNPSEERSTQWREEERSSPSRRCSLRACLQSARTQLRPSRCGLRRPRAQWPIGKIATTPRATLIALFVASIVGAFIGVIILLHTSDAAFMGLVPFLLLGATILFTFGGAISARLLKRNVEAPLSERAVAVGVVAQALIAVYGGYFGAGMGILMLSMMSLVGMTNIHGMNALRNVLSVLINGVAVIVFVASGAIAWKPGLVMTAGGIIGGGYSGRAIARKLESPMGEAFRHRRSVEHDRVFLARADTDRLSHLQRTLSVRGRPAPKTSVQFRRTSRPRIPSPPQPSPGASMIVMSRV